MTGKIRPCVHCGVMFRPEFPKGAARTCSDECAKARRRVTANAAGKTYYMGHGEEVRAKFRAHAKANRPTRNAQWKRWADRNRAKRNARQRELYAERKRHV